RRARALPQPGGDARVGRRQPGRKARHAGGHRGRGLVPLLAGRRDDPRTDAGDRRRLVAPGRLTKPVSSHDERPLALILDWDGTVTERDGLHMAIERFGDLGVFDALEHELGKPLTLDEVIAAEMATIRAPLEDVRDWLVEHVRVRPGFRELVAEHAPPIVSSGVRRAVGPDP